MLVKYKWRSPNILMLPLLTLKTMLVKYKYFKDNIENYYKDCFKNNAC